MRAGMLACVAAAACGRIGFAPHDPAGDGGTIGAFAQLALPGGGEALAVAVAASAPGTLYAVAGGRVWRSTTGGAQWTDCRRAGFARQLAIDPADAQTIYVGDDAGLHRSSDACASWTTLLAEETTAIAVAGGDIVVGARGVRRWRGGTWTSLPSAADGRIISSVALGPGGVLFASTFDVGIVRSIDDGASFALHNTGLVNGNVHRVVFADPQAASGLVVQADSGLYYSTDTGASWSRSTGGDAGRDSVAIDPADTAFVVAGTWSGLMRSLDGGMTYDPTERRTANMAAAWIEDLVFDLHTPGRVLAATNRGVFAADSHALDWYALSAGMDAWVIRELTGPPDSDTLYAATSSGVLRSDDGGDTWSVEATGMEVGDSLLRTVHVPAGASAGLFAGGSSWFWRSSDGATSFAPATTVTSADRYAITVARTLGNKIWFGTGGRLWRSTDGGSAWTQHAILGVSRWITDIAIVGPDELWVATDQGVFHTIDDAASFAPVPGGPADPASSSLVRLADGTMLAGTRDGVYAAASASAGWTARGLAGIPVRDLLVAGSRTIAATDAGVFVSDDGGGAWQPIAGLSDRRPKCLWLDRAGRLLVGTDGFGLYRAAL